MIIYHSVYNIYGGRAKRERKALEKSRFLHIEYTWVDLGAKGRGAKASNEPEVLSGHRKTPRHSA